GMKSALALVLQAAPQSHEPQLIDIDATLFIQLGIFLLALVVLSRFLWKPYMRVRTERVARAEAYREEATRPDPDAHQRLPRARAPRARRTRPASTSRRASRG